jgi:hypothetical protein
MTDLEALNLLIATGDKVTSARLDYLQQTLGVNKLFLSEEFNQLKQSLKYLRDNSGRDFNPEDYDLSEFLNESENPFVRESGLPVIPTINYLNVTPSDEVDSTSLVLVESIPLEQILMESNLEALLTIECMLIEVTAGLVNIRIEVRLRGETEPNHVLLATAQSSSASIRQMNFQREIIIRDNNLITVQTNSTLLTNIGAQSTAPTVEIPIFNDDAHYLDIFIRRTGTGGTPGTVQKLSTKLTLEKQNL